MNHRGNEAPASTASPSSASSASSPIWSRLKRFDFYGEAPKDLTEQTKSGALISVVAFLLIVYLVISEFASFLSPAIESTIFVDHPAANARTLYGDVLQSANDLSQSQLVDDYDRLPIVFNISLPALPCIVISLDVQDVMGTQAEDVQMGVKKVRIDRETMRPLLDRFGDELSGDISTANPSEQSNEGCRLQGTIVVKKVAGNIHISAHSHIQTMRQLFPSGDLNMTHYIHQFHFGAPEHMKRLRDAKALATEPLSGSRRVVIDPHAIARRSGASGLPSAPMLSYEYLVKAIPTIYESISTGESHRSYQYVAHSNAVMNRYQPQAIFVRFDIDGLTVAYRRQSKSFAHFITQLCAIVGGVFTVLGLINMAALSASQKFKSSIGKLG